MQLKRKPTAHTWLGLVSLSIAGDVVAFHVLPERSQILAIPADAISIIVAQAIASVPPLVVALVARSPRSVFLSAGALHCVGATASLFAPTAFVRAQAVFEISILTPFEKAVQSVWIAILGLALAEIAVAIIYGLAGLWLASTCQPQASEEKAGGREQSARRRASSRIQCVALLAGILAVPSYVEVVSRWEESAVENLKAAGARIIFVPDSRFIDWLFGTRSRVLLSGQRFDDQMLAKLPRLRRLDRLTLERCAITDDGLKPLSGLRDLQMLWILDCPITDQGLAYLEPLRSLFVAGFFGDRLSADGIGKLEAAWNPTWIVYDRRARLKSN
jgi:hypothetical protein